VLLLLLLRALLAAVLTSCVLQLAAALLQHSLSNQILPKEWIMVREAGCCCVLLMLSAVSSRCRRMA
jgi:hypothetical protein